MVSSAWTPRVQGEGRGCVEDSHGCYTGLGGASWGHMASRDEECAPGIEPLPAPLKSVEAGRRGCCALGVGGRGGGCRLQRNYRVVIFFSHLPNPPPTSELPLPFLGLCPRPSLHPCPRLFLSLPRSPGPPSPSLFLLSGSLFLSEPLSPPLSGSLLSFSHLLSVSPLSG